MGQKGSNVQGITSKFNVQIKFPEKAKVPNGDAPVVNGEAPTNGNGNDHQDCDIIKISGKKENCDAAANALKALVPINIDVEVPYKFHRFIIGQKGVGVRKLMEVHINIFTNVILEDNFLENCRVYAFGVWIMLSKSHPQGLVHNFTCKLQLLLTV